jgi:hypothetical protein
MLVADREVPREQIPWRDRFGGGDISAVED